MFFGRNNAMRKATRLMTLAGGLAALGLAAACFNVNPDLDRANLSEVWKKGDFDGSWYFASTVVKSAPNAMLYEGDSDFIITERVTWEVTEDALIAWRDYETAEGADDAALEGGDDVFKGQPVAKYAIVDHFDIRRVYDPVTGEEGNVIEPNRERPWYEREYMSVNWASNEIGTSFRLNPGMYGLAASVETVTEHDKADPKRYRFDDIENGYFEFTNRLQVEPDLYAILGLYGRDHYYDMAATVIDVRSSFYRVPDSDYIPLNMPDNVPLVNEMGQEVRDENGITQQVPVNDRFGFFTTWHRQVWDPNRGFTYAGEKSLALRHNIWEKNRNADGSIIPIAERDPKPIVYYTNQRHPQQLLQAARRVGIEWNDVFKDMVFHAQPGRYASKDEVPDMFIVEENSCNPTTVSDAFDALPALIKSQVQLAALKKDTNDETNYLNIDGDRYSPFDGTPAHVMARYEWANSHDNTSSFTTRQDLETQALADLERICTAMEHYTHPKQAGEDSGVEYFTYQRIGDLRYNFINGIVEKALAPWLGVATILGDPETGEMVTGVANIGLSAVDTSAYRANEAIQALEGEIGLDDIFHGYDVQAYVARKLRDSRQLALKGAGPQARQRMEGQLNRLRGAEDGLREISPEHNRSKLSLLAGTRIEDAVTSDYDLMAYARVTPDQINAMDGDSMEAMMDMASRFRNRDQFDLEKMIRTFDKMGELGIDTNAFLDDFAFGAAVKYRDLNPRERFEQIREDLYVSTQLHEVGHSLGLRHNFEASTDALNYHDEFWAIEQLPANLTDALGAAGEKYQEAISYCIDEQTRLRQELGDPEYTTTTQQCLGQNQYMFSTIMEYNGHWSADFGGLGKYDYAAIKFGYAQLVETFGNPAADRTEQETTKELFYNDWRDIPTDIVNGYDALTDRQYTTWKWDYASVMSEPPVNTVPYRFCTDNYMTPTCNRWDFGPDTQTNAMWQEYTYYQRYFFTHFNRDRFWDFQSGWWGGGSWWGGVSADLRSLTDYTQKMKWFAYYAVNDPDFTPDTYAYQDYLTTTQNGLNHFSKVLSHPGSGRYVTVTESMVDHLTNNDPETVDRLAPSDIMTTYEFLSGCVQQNVMNGNAVINELGDTVWEPTTPVPGHNFGEVDLGDGRPFALGSLRTESEEWVINYVGSYYTKDYAIYLLSNPQAWFPATDVYANPRNFFISWYTLFPDHVGTIVNRFVTEQFADLGPVVSRDDGTVQLRNIIDTETGDVMEYDPADYTRIIPTVAFNNQYYAAVYSMMLMSSPWDGQYDMMNSYNVAVEGAGDDIGAYDTLPPEQVVEFVHPDTGMRIRAIDTGDGAQPIAANLVRRANVLKKRYEVLDECAEGVRDPNATPYCQCAEAFRAQVNNGEQGLFCSDFNLLDVGDGGCGEYELINRRDRARELMDDMVDFIDDVRFVRNVLNN